MVEVTKRRMIKARSFQTGFSNILNRHDKELDKIIYEASKKKYTEEFNITLHQFDLIWNFFNERTKNIGASLDINLIKSLMRESIKNRPQVKATATDSDRAVSLMDANDDRKINIDEFVKLMSLFFANKKNLKQRIIGVLKNQSSKHETVGHLTQSEAASFENFLVQFYNAKNGADSNHGNGISYDEMADHLSAKLQSFLFC